MFCLNGYMCTICLSSAHRDKKRASDSLELGSQFCTIITGSETGPSLPKHEVLLATELAL